MRLHCLRAPDEPKNPVITTIYSIPPPPIHIQTLAMTALDLGVIKQMLDTPILRDHPARSCVLRAETFQNTPELIEHLRRDHESTWHHHGYLVDIIQNTLGPQQPCACPDHMKTQEPGHVCVALRQLAMAHRASDQCILVPHSFEAEQLWSALHNTIPAELLQQVQIHLMTRNFEPVLRDQDLHHRLRNHCILCASQVDTMALNEHIEKDHPDDQGLCRALCQDSDAIVIVLDRCSDMQDHLTQPLQVQGPMDTINMPVFANDAGDIAHQIYWPMALVFHLGGLRSGHYICAVRCVDGWKIYNDNAVPSTESTIQLTPDRKLTQIWAMKSLPWNST